jgi:hypothetical protein
VSEFGTPQPYQNSCGASIYFDRDSTIGHPSENKWVSLEFVNGIKTDNPYDCPIRKTGSKTTNTSAMTSAIPPTQEPILIEVIHLMKMLISKMHLLIKHKSLNNAICNKIYKVVYLQPRGSAMK